MAKTMRVTGMALLLLLGLRSGAAAVSTPYWTMVLNSGNLPCTNGVIEHAVGWDNPEPSTPIRELRLWFGMVSGDVSDIWGQAFDGAIPDWAGALTPRISWDHYHNPTGLNDQMYRERFDPPILANRLVLLYGCTGPQNVGLIELWIRR